MILDTILAVCVKLMLIAFSLAITLSVVLVTTAVLPVFGYNAAIALREWWNSPES